MRLQSAVSLLLALAVATPSHASSFEDFRIPTLDAASAFATVDGQFSRSSMRNLDLAQRTTRGDGLLVLGASRFHDSDPSYWRVALVGSVRGLWHQSTSFDYDQDPPVGPPVATSLVEHTRRERTLNEIVELSASIRRYPWERAIGLSASGRVQLDELQRWDLNTQREETSTTGALTYVEVRSNTTFLEYAETASVEGAVGVGRVRDASPVFQAILLEERLRRDRVLSGPLRQETRQKIAELYAMRTSFGIVHQLPDKFFWEELERLLREDGAVGDGGLRAYAVRHADEALVVVRSGFPRPVGFFAGPTIRASHRHLLQKFAGSTSSRVTVDGAVIIDGTSSSSSRIARSEVTTYYGAQVEWHRPLGERTQLDFAEGASIEVASEPEAVIVAGVARIAHLVAERWFLAATAGHSRYLHPASDVDSWGAQAAGSISWFIEDRVLMELSAQQVWDRQRQSFPAPDRIRRNDFRLRAGITVRTGRLDAPGLISPQRPLN